MKPDCIVLGAGIVGVSAALHLQQRGRTVVLVDRRGAAEETSYGNAGIIQREGIIPYTFPRELSKLLKYARNDSPDAHFHWDSLGFLAPILYRFWKHGTPEHIDRTARAMRPLIERVLIEHEALMTEAGIAGMMRHTGYLKLYRDPRKLEAALVTEEANRARYGITFEAADARRMRELEPHFSDEITGGILLPQPASVGDPSAVGKAYADLFRKQGGRFVTADARTLERVGDHWQVQTVDGPIRAGDALVALGPWSNVVLSAQGIRVPLAVKRGYHMHYTTRGNATLSRPVVDTDHGYAMAPMSKGIRLTTGVEFARRDALPTPVQLGRVEPLAKAIFPLESRVEEKPWMGARPFLPDMLPMIGPVVGRPGLWADFGHHHLGFTMGPVSGRLIAEMMTGSAPFTDPHPYRVDRFA